MTGYMVFYTHRSNISLSRCAGVIETRCAENGPSRSHRKVIQNQITTSPPCNPTPHRLVSMLCWFVHVSCYHRCLATTHQSCGCLLGSRWGCLSYFKTNIICHCFCASTRVVLQKQNEETNAKGIFNYFFLFNKNPN